jgi:hypothetical protein
MHLLGKEVKVTLTPPDGKPTTLVAIKDWDYNWQETYFFKEAITVFRQRAGSACAGAAKRTSAIVEQSAMRSRLRFMSCPPDSAHSLRSISSSTYFH